MTAVCNTNMALCLGPTNSGKTLLLKKLQHPNSVDSTTSSVATVGTNLFTIRGNIGTNATTASVGVVKSVTVRELGGSMAPLWPRFFTDVRKVMYVVDTSNLCQISAAGVLFYSILSNPLLKSAKFLIVLTKMDVSYRQMRNEAILMLQLNRLQKEISQNVTITEASAISGEGNEFIRNWLLK